MAQIRRGGNPHVRPEWRHRAVNERPISIDSSGQKRCIFVVRRHDDAISLKASEVFSQSQRYSGAAAGIGCVSDHVSLQLWHESDARILDTPDLLRIVLRAGHQRRRVINLPSIHPVLRASGTKMGQAASIFYAAKQ